jgi:hypothetical protein
MVGQVVHMQRLESSTAREEVVLNIELPSGVYVINLQAGEINESLRMVVE